MIRKTYVLLSLLFLSLLNFAPKTTHSSFPTKKDFNFNSIRKGMVTTTFNASADLCDCDRRRPITITSTTTETDYQIMLDVNFVTGMSSDFSDIRFTDSDGSTEISFWIEEFTVSDDATVWIKVPSVPNGTKTIYMYYDGCTSSNTSNAANTFIFYDDMNSTTGWNTYGSGAVSATTTLGSSTLSKTTNCDPNGGWKSIGQTITNFRLITREVRTTAGNNNGCGLDRYGIENSGFNGYNINRDARGGNRVFGLEARTNGSGNNANRPNRNQPIDTWFRTELTRCCSSNTVTAQLYDDNRNAIGGLVSSTMPNNRNYCNFDRVTVRGGHNYHIDFMAVAKSSCGTIGATIGAEDGSADLKLTKTVNNALPKVGDNITYTIRVHNAGPLCGTGVLVEDIIPSGLTFVSYSSTSGTTYSTGTNTWDLTSISILPTEFAELQITVTIDSAGQIINTAKITQSDKDDPDSDPTN